MSDQIKNEHQFTSSWRWTDEFEAFVERHLSGRTANVFSGLSPLGDCRIDLMSPVEIIELLQSDENTSLDDARRILDDLLEDTYIGRDVVQELFTAESPADHPLAEYIDTEGFIRANIFQAGLPLGDNSFDSIVADPPWKAVNKSARRALLDELTRVVKPGGCIIFNAWFIPTSQQTTIEAIRFRQDTERHATGTPNLSYTAVYRVHESKEIAQYLARSLTPHEYEPEPESVEEAINAEIAMGFLNDGISPNEYDIDVIGATDAYRCPHCGSPSLSIASAEAGFSPPADDDLYRCNGCDFPAKKSELNRDDSDQSEQPQAIEDNATAIKAR